MTSLPLQRPNFQNLRYLATAARGTEPFLVDELTALGAMNIQVVPGGVSFRGDINLGMKACLWSRVAMQVLVELGQAKINSDKQLYNAVRKLPLHQWFSADHTLAVYAHTRGKYFKNSKFVALKVKDAIVDTIRDQFQRRPDIDLTNPDIAVGVNIIDTDAYFYIRMQGEPLNQRGYRRKKVDAPMKETLAAALIYFSGWTPQQPLHDPLCGSGTIAIEAALMATDTAPGLYRSFGFQKWPFYKEALQDEWMKIHQNAYERRQNRLPQPILASDINPKAVAATRRNAATLGFDDLIEVSRATVEQTDSFHDWGFYITNPPYGERLESDEEDILNLHRQISHTTRQYANHKLAVISVPWALKGGMRLKPDKKLPVFNGQLECQFALYSMRGS